MTFKPKSIKKILTNSKIITNKQMLSIPTIKVDTIAEGEEIATQLFNILNTTKNALGLSANQIGINKSVCVTNVNSPRYFINPKIINHSDNKILFLERCLSFPGRKALVERRTSIEVIADNLELPITFKTYNKNHNTIDDLYNDVNLLECITIQHEIDHLNGITMLDNNVLPQPIISDKKIGRNDKISLIKGEQTIFIKYKQIDFYLNNGWILNG